MKLVRESLYENTGYSPEELKQDFEEYINSEIPEISPEKAEMFFNDVVKPAFDNQLIGSTAELINFASEKINEYI